MQINSSSNVLQNRHSSEQILLSRECRQGDPPPPYILFYVRNSEFCFFAIFSAILRLKVVTDHLWLVEETGVLGKNHHLTPRHWQLPNSSIMSKDQFFGNTKRPLCADVSLNPHSFMIENDSENFKLIAQLHGLKQYMQYLSPGWIRCAFFRQNQIFRKYGSKLLQVLQ